MSRNIEYASNLPGRPAFRLDAQRAEAVAPSGRSDARPSPLTATPKDPWPALRREPALHRAPRAMVRKVRNKESLPVGSASSAFFLSMGNASKAQGMTPCRPVVV